MRILSVLIKNLVFVTLISAAGTVMADESDVSGDVAITTNNPVSANDAKRIVRRYLSEQGYSRSIGPGGARIRGVELVTNQWIVEVFLRDRSATAGSRYTISVDTGTGLLSGVAPVRSAKDS